jgi:hypothetical protein
MLIILNWQIATSHRFERGFFYWQRLKKEE